MTPEECTQLAIDIAAVINASHRKDLTEEELQWVRLAIEAESRKIRFRDAVISKTLSGLVWSGIVGFGYVMLDFLKNHGFKA